MLVDPYNDPAWADVQTGSGQTYRGTKPNFFTRSTNVTSLSFDGVGRIYYTLYGTTALYSRTFSPDSGVMGTEEVTVPGTLPKDLTGAFLSGGRLWYATANGTLWSQAFGGPAGLSGTATAVPGTGPGGTSWAGPVLYLAAQGQPPVAAATVRCVDLRCSADGTASSDPDGGTLTSYAWSWGDGTTGTGATATHDYATPGTYPVVLTVTDSAGSTGSSPAQYVTVAAHVNTAPTAAFTRELHPAGVHLRRLGQQRRRRHGRVLGLDVRRRRDRHRGDRPAHLRQRRQLDRHPHRHGRQRRDGPHQPGAERPAAAGQRDRVPRQQHPDQRLRHDPQAGAAGRDAGRRRAAAQGRPDRQRQPDGTGRLDRAGPGRLRPGRRAAGRCGRRSRPPRT